MTERPFFTAVAVGLGFLAAVNVAMIPWSRRLPSQIVLHRIRTSGPSDLLFLGNSLLDGRLDTNDLNRGSIATGGRTFQPLNAALGASAPQDQALLMTYAEKCHPETRTLAVGFFDFQLTNEQHLRPADLTGTHGLAVQNPLPLSEVAAIYDLHGLERAEVLLLRAVPMAANRMNAWKYVELLRRAMNQMGMPRLATNDMGRAADFSALEAGTPQKFDDQAAEFLKDPTHFNRSYERIFMEAQQQHMRVVLILMPMSPYHRATYYSRPAWNRYFQRLQEIANQRGFRVVDASGWLPEDDRFVDRLHMSAVGIHEFSYRVGATLATEERPQAHESAIPIQPAKP